jgi:hypothetical protein
MTNGQANTREEPPEAPVKEWLSPGEFAEHSGLSPATVQRRLAAGDLPKVQPGGPRCRVLIPRTALNDLAARGKNPAAVIFEFKPSAAAPQDDRLAGPPPRWKKQKRKLN